jgi:hypothetical protein
MEQLLPLLKALLTLFLATQAIALVVSILAIVIFAVIFIKLWKGL